MTTRQRARRQRLIPGGIPRYVRCYDNGGKTADRYTVCFTGRAAKMSGAGIMPDQWPLLAMSGSPFHPQGVGMHSHTNFRPADVVGGAWGGPAIGRRCRLGKRIPFRQLPADCRKLVLQDYKEIWGL